MLTTLFGLQMKQNNNSSSLPCMFTLSQPPDWICSSARHISNDPVHLRRVVLPIRATAKPFYKLSFLNNAHLHYSTVLFKYSVSDLTTLLSRILSDNALKNNIIT